MTKRLAIAFLFLALAVASAKTYSVTLFQPSVVAGTELQAGDYRLNLDSDKIVLTNGKQSVQSAVQVEQTDGKFSSTTVRYANAEGKFRIQEIRLGGTKLKLVFNN
jgi:major membrane immunogen (membrane-anchored lipoprotein)